MKIASVSVEVDELALVVDEVRSGVPRRNVQFDQAVTGYPEGDNILEAGPPAVAQITWRRHPDQPFLAAQRTEALRDSTVSRNPAEVEADMRQVHDPQPRFAMTQDKLRLTRRGFGVVVGLCALAARAQRCDDLAIRGKRLRRQLPNVEHVRGQRARIIHG